MKEEVRKAFEKWVKYPKCFKDRINLWDEYVVLRDQYIVKSTKKSFVKEFPKKMECLKCDDKFYSSGIHNRLCFQCAQINEKISLFQKETE